ncbi:MAG: hypothetical protein MUF06_21145, partial [Pirellulaceae bacterium]|nr:hypothetical protein [Pirellulaceae bacterium]
MRPNPYASPSHPPVRPRRSSAAITLAIVSCLMLVVAIAAIAAFYWAFEQYPVMGQLVGAPPADRLQVVMGASCALALLAMVLAFVAAYASIRLFGQ